MEFFNTTKHRVEHFDYITSIRLRSSGVRAYRTIIVIFGLIMILLGIANMPSASGFIYLAVAIGLFLFAAAGVRTSNTKNALKNAKIEESRSYMITENGILAKSEDSDEVQSFKYEEFSGVYVSEDAIYLKFLGKKNMFLVMDFDGFPEDTVPKDVIDFLEGKGFQIHW